MDDEQMALMFPDSYNVENQEDVLSVFELE